MVPNAPNAIQSVGNYGAVPPDLSGWPEPNTLVPVAINWHGSSLCVHAPQQLQKPSHSSVTRAFTLVCGIVTSHQYVINILPYIQSRVCYTSSVKRPVF